MSKKHERQIGDNVSRLPEPRETNTLESRPEVPGTMRDELETNGKRRANERTRLHAVGPWDTRHMRDKFRMMETNQTQIGDKVGRFEGKKEEGKHMGGEETRIDSVESSSKAPRSNR